MLCTSKVNRRDNFFDRERRADTRTPLHPAALASVPYGVVLARVRISLQRKITLQQTSGLSSVLTLGTAPPPPFSLGTGPFGVLCGRLGQAITQGDAFFALCHEAGGRMGDSAYNFLGMIIDSAGGSASDRMAFKVYV